jgi:hypothetical protein
MLDKLNILLICLIILDITVILTALIIVYKNCIVSEYSYASLRQRVAKTI